MNNYSRQLEVKENLKAFIILDNFQLRVVSSHQARKVHINILAGIKDAAEGLFAIDYIESDNKLLIKQVKRKHDTKGILEVNLPPDSDLTCKSANGNLNFKELRGNLTVSSENGNVRLSECDGRISISSENGAINARKINGTVKLKSENGSVAISEGQGTLTVKIENGQVRSSNSHYERAEVKTENGSIYYKIPLIEKGSFTMKSENGAIRISIPADLSYKLEAANKTGRFHMALPDNYEADGENGRRVIRSVRGAGKVTIAVANKRGSISILGDKTGATQQVGFEGVSAGGMGLHSENLKALKNELKEWKDELKNKVTNKVLKKLEQIGKSTGENRMNLDDNNEFNNGISTIPEDNDAFAGKETGNRLTPEKGKDDEVITGNVTSEAEMLNKRKTVAELEEKVLKMLEQGMINVDEADQLIDVIREEN